MTTIAVSCRAHADRWVCRVDLEDDDGSRTSHDMSVSREDLARLSPSATEPTDLVRRSFSFLLDREPKESILRTFELPVIGRYFPEYESTIRA